jgi:hypothetical protein
MNFKKYLKSLNAADKAILAMLAVNVGFYIWAIVTKTTTDDDTIVDSMKLAILTCDLLMFSIFIIKQNFFHKQGFSYGLILIVLTIMGLVGYNIYLIQQQAVLLAEADGTEQTSSDALHGLLTDTVSIFISTLVSLLYLQVYTFTKHTMLSLMGIVMVLFNLVLVVVSMSQVSDLLIDVGNLTSILVNILMSVVFYTGRVKIEEDKARFETIWERGDLQEADGQDAVELENSQA